MKLADVIQLGIDTTLQLVWMAEREKYTVQAGRLDSHTPSKGSALGNCQGLLLWFRLKMSSYIDFLNIAHIFDTLIISTVENIAKSVQFFFLIFTFSLNWEIKLNTRLLQRPSDAVQGESVSSRCLFTACVLHDEDLGLAKYSFPKWHQLQYDPQALFPEEHQEEGGGWWRTPLWTEPQGPRYSKWAGKRISSKRFWRTNTNFVLKFRGAGRSLPNMAIHPTVEILLFLKDCRVRWPEICLLMLFSVGRCFCLLGATRSSFPHSCKSPSNICWDSSLIQGWRLHFWQVPRAVKGVGIL